MAPIFQGVSNWQFRNFKVGNTKKRKLLEKTQKCLVSQTQWLSHWDNLGIFPPGFFFLQKFRQINWFTKGFYFDGNQFQFDEIFWIWGKFLIECIKIRQTDGTSTPFSLPRKICKLLWRKFFSKVIFFYFLLFT